MGVCGDLLLVGHARIELALDALQVALLRRSTRTGVIGGDGGLALSTDLLSHQQCDHRRKLRSFVTEAYFGCSFWVRENLLRTRLMPSDNEIIHTGTTMTWFSTSRIRTLYSTLTRSSSLPAASRYRLAAIEHPFSLVFAVRLWLLLRALALLVTDTGAFYIDYLMHQ